MTTYIHPTSKIAAEFWQHGRSESCPVIDMHGHMGAFCGIHFPVATPREVAAHLERTGVRLMCFAHHDALGNSEIGNSTALEAVQACPEVLRAYLTVNPNYHEATKRELPLLEKYSEVFVGFKLHPGMHNVALDDRKYDVPLSIANERKLPVLIHTWGGAATCGVPHVRNVAAKYPGAILILGHALFGAWEEGIQVAKDFPNAYLELTAVVGKRGILEMFVKGAGSRQVLYGTDLPWFDEHQYIGGILSADITDEDRHNILHRNAERILGL